MMAAVILKGRHSDPEHEVGPVPTGPVTHKAQHSSSSEKGVNYRFPGMQAPVFEFLASSICALCI